MTAAPLTYTVSASADADGGVLLAAGDDFAIEYALHLVTPEPAHRVELLHRNLQKFGTVYNTLAAVCEVSGTVSASPPTT